MSDRQTDEDRPDAEIAKRLQAMVRRIAGIQPKPKPNRRSWRSAEDKAIIALDRAIVGYFEETATPTIESYVRCVLHSFVKSHVKTYLRRVTDDAACPSIVAVIDPIADRMTARAAEQYWLRVGHYSSPTVSAAPASC